MSEHFSVLKCIPILVFIEVHVFLVGLNVYEPMCRYLVEYVYTYVSEHMNVNGYNWVNFWICYHLTTEWLCKCMYVFMNICALCAFVLIYKCVSKTYGYVSVYLMSQCVVRECAHMSWSLSGEASVWIRYCMHVCIWAYMGGLWW